MSDGHHLSVDVHDARAHLAQAGVAGTGVGVEDDVRRVGGDVEAACSRRVRAAGLANPNYSIWGG